MANKKEVIRQLKEHLHLQEDEYVWELLEILRNNIRNKIRENRKSNKKGIEKIFLARILLNGIKKQKKKQEEQRDIRGIVFKNIRRAEELKKYWLDIKNLLELGYGSYKMQKILEEKGIKVSRPVIVKIINNYKQIKENKSKKKENKEKEVKEDGKLKW